MRDPVDAVLESPGYIATVEPNAFYERFEDMSPTGRLRVFVQEDGDVILSIIEDDERGSGYASAEFCMPFTGGGQSPRVHAALKLLAEAIRRDNQERAQHRQS